MILEIGIYREECVTRETHESYAEKEEGRRKRRRP
jgi:hypothetical protein